MLVRFGLKIGNEVHVRLAAHQPHDKIGYSSISFGGRFGRSARMDVDDVDVSDERGSIAFVPSMRGAIASRQILESQKFPAPNGTSTLRE